MSGCFRGIVLGLFLFSFANAILAQTKEGFYDNNNYDLRNLPAGDPESDILPDVDVRPRFERPALATPKSAKTQFSAIESIPGAGALLNSRTSGNINQNANNPYMRAGGANGVINPLTGEVNPEALQNQLQKSRQKQEQKKKQKEEFDEEAVYEETKFRRGYIIFFLTLPFALGASAGAVALLPVAAQKSAVASAILITGSLGLSGTNVYLDQRRLEEHREKKKTLATSSSEN